MKHMNIKYDEVAALAKIKNLAFIVGLETSDGKKEDFCFDSDNITIGRSSRNDLVIEDSYVSRQHASIQNMGNGTFKVTAFKSTSPLLLKDGSSVKSIILKPGDSVKIGKTWISISFPSGLATQVQFSVPNKKDEDSYIEEPAMETLALYDEYGDEDEEADEMPVYSMRQQLIDELPQDKMTGEIGWEVVRYRDELIYDCVPLEPAEEMNLADKDSPRVLVDKDGQLKIKGDSGLKISITGESSTFELISQKLRFDQGNWAIAPTKPFTLENKGVYFLIRSRHRPKTVISEEKMSLEPQNAYIMGGSTWLHFAAIMLFGMLNPPMNEIKATVTQEDLSRFASIAMEELQPEPEPTPAPAPKIQEPIETKPVQPTKPTNKVQKSKYMARQNFKVRTRNTGANSIPDVTQVGALGKIGGKGLYSPTDTARSSRLVAAVSNVTGVRAHGGAQTFSVSGNIGGMPGKDVRFARITDIKGGPRSGTRLGDGFGATTVGAKTNRKVKGLVVDISPPPIEVSVRGGLTRDEIAAVVQQHVSEIRYCYEKGLLEDSTLGGKISAKWTISPAGSVVTSGIGSSTVRNGGVHRCLVQEIQSWNFPKPRNGGAVLVSFPFVFNSSSF